MYRLLFYLLLGGTIFFLLSEEDVDSQSVRTAPSDLVEAEKAESIPTVAAVAPSASLVEPSKRPIYGLRLYVVGDRVNFRSGPGLREAVVGTLTRGAEVQSGDQSGNWTAIQTLDGREGWMSSQYLSQSLPQVARVPSRGVAVPSGSDITAARQAIIRQSISSYPGSCACPYNRDRAGRRCGGRSAWSRPGGYAPICYHSDVTDARLASYFARRRGVN